MINGVPFKRVTKVLEEAGFRHETIDGSHHLFTHDATGSHVTLPLGERTVRSVFVAGIARVVDENGILERDEFLNRVAQVNGTAAHR
jgi:predicted RNA binding protein YcfA (HicA-like mRNA interferase family)